MGLDHGEFESADAAVGFRPRERKLNEWTNDNDADEANQVTVTLTNERVVVIGHRRRGLFNVVTTFYPIRSFELVDIGDPLTWEEDETSYGGVIIGGHRLHFRWDKEGIRNEVSHARAIRLSQLGKTGPQDQGSVFVRRQETHRTE